MLNMQRCSFSVGKSDKLSALFMCFHGSWIKQFQIFLRNKEFGVNIVSSADILFIIFPFPVSLASDILVRHKSEPAGLKCTERQQH